jgi:hypothetical protein
MLALLEVASSCRTQRVTDLPPWRRRELVLTQIFVRDRTDTAKHQTE